MMWRLRLIVFGALGLLSCGTTSRALAEPHFLDSQVFFDGLFPAEAILTASVAATYQTCLTNQT